MASLLEIHDLSVEYHTFKGRAQAVNHLHLVVGGGESLGLVGETGAGKTTTALSILRLLPQPVGRIVGGEIKFKGRNILELPELEMRRLRGNEISMIFQNPMTSLNPVFTVGEQIAAVLAQHQGLQPREAQERAGGMLEVVGIPAYRANEYPHQFSGGMRQRVGIAMALACRPELLIADEPTTALDVTIQAQVLALMNELKEKFRMSLIMITHNLGIVAEICDRVAVMYAGSIVESGTVAAVFGAPAHPYSRGLFGSLPDLERRSRRLRPVEGMMPDPLHLPRGCAFYPRCPEAAAACAGERPNLVPVAQDHSVACLKAGRGGGGR
ncbi:MAG: peptide/nickel transport system ATP-binding protein [Bacillota bacterium]|nr:peptide/nickel transport system ATP-binding protein [Bacillota bacterium]